MSNDILSAAVEANEAEVPVNLNITEGILDKATEVPTEEQTQELSALANAKTHAAIDANSLTPEQIQQLMRPRKVIQQVRNYKKIGRNEKCPCGSGKKYKNCCLDSGKYEGYHNVNEGETKVA